MRQDYSTFVVDGYGHFGKSINFFCVDDEDAKSRAEQMLDRRPIELWQGARWVLTLLPEK
jgi:hypothetical protein